MSNYKKGVNNIEDAIIEHVKQQKGKSSIVTGWIVIASVSDVESPDRDGYILQASQALPYHAQVGLLQTAVDDKKNLGMLATIKAMMGDD